jgi:hypothetical protein
MYISPVIVESDIHLRVKIGRWSRQNRQQDEIAPEKEEVLSELFF